MKTNISRNRAVKYLNNKELLAEIAKCKKTFCTFISPEYADYDLIVQDLSTVTSEMIDETLAKINSKLIDGQPLRDRSHFVVRVMTYDHVPIDPTRKRKSRVTNQNHSATNFPPFKHYAWNDSANDWIEVGRSHWDGDFDTGRFTTEKGRISERLGMMFMLLVERYSNRSNWRGYCVDEETEALTMRGWVSGDEITKDDIILSYDGNGLQWSKIFSIFRDDFDGLMFRLVGQGFDALVTPNHKFVTLEGLKPVELLTDNDVLVLMGSTKGLHVKNIDFYEGKRVDPEHYGKITNPNVPTVEYKGKVWCPETEYGCFMARRNGKVYLTGNTYNDEMCGLALTHLSQVGLQFDESRSSNPFAFLTTTITHCFTRTLTLEKKNQSIRDDILINMGMTPSYTRQIENELAQQLPTDNKKLTPRRGRKTSAHVKAEKEADKQNDLD